MVALTGLVLVLTATPCWAGFLGRLGLYVAGAACAAAIASSELAPGRFARLIPDRRAREAR